MGNFLSSQNSSDDTNTCGDTETPGDTETSDDTNTCGDTETSGDTDTCEETETSGDTEIWDDAEACDDTEDEKEQLCLLLMGKTGHGKSSLGNRILGHKTFEVSNDTSSQTAEVACGYSNFESFSLKVVDGPGLQDTELSQLEDTERAVRNMSAALTMCSEGVDVFLFVFSFGTRFTEDEVSVLETLRVIFGQDYLKHAIVVLTHGDQFDTEEITFDEWCKKQTGSFRELYEACDGRCVLFNNKERSEENQIAQRKQLTQLAYELKRRHGCYTADCFKLAQSERQRLIITLKQPILKEEIQKQAGILTSKIEKYRQQPCGEDRAEIEKDIRKLKNEIKIEDKGRGLLEDLMKTVEDIERNLHDTVTLRRLAKRLENTRKAAKIWTRVGIFFNVAGGILCAVCPKASSAITLGVNAANALGTEIIKTVERTTETKLNYIKSNMST